MANQMELTAHEIEARQMIIDYRKNNEWDTHRQIALMVWRAMWSSALPVAQIQAIGQAMNNLISTPDLQAELTRMVRRGLLRSAVRDGRRLYELALS